MNDKYLKFEEIENQIKHVIIGKTVKEAESLLQRPIRVIKEDGESYAVTCDFVSERINVTVENGIITEFNGVLSL